MMRFRRYSVELYTRLGVFERLGSLRIASSPESLVELRRGASRARGIGLDVEVLGPAEALALMPAASPSRCTARSGCPSDGCVDPHTATHALATPPATSARGSARTPGDRDRARRRRRGARRR